MALINCPECGREVSDQADACPRCAYPLGKKLAAARPAPEPDPETDPPSEPTPFESPASDELPGTGERSVWEGHPSQIVNLKPFLGWFLVTAAIVAVPVLAHAYLDEYITEEFGPHTSKVYWILVLLVFPFVAVAWKWLKTSSIRYVLTSERIKLRTGIIARHHEVVELYRVKDLSLERPIFMRLCGLGHVIALTSDKSQPTVTFYAVHRPGELLEELRENVEACRVRRGVREMDMGADHP